MLRLDSVKGTKLSTKATAVTALAAGADVFVFAAPSKG